MAEKISVEIALEGGAEVERQLEDIGKSGQQALGNIQSAADSVDLTSIADQFNNVQTAVKSAAAFEQVVQGVKKVEGAFEALGTAATKVAARMTRSLGVIGVAARALGPLGIALGAAGGAFIKFGDDAADALNKLNVEGAKLGLTAQQFDRLRQALGQFGISADALSGLQQLKETLAQDFFPTDVITGFQRFIAQLEQMPDSVQRTQLAIQTLGENLGGQVIAGLQTGALSAQNFAAALGQVSPATQQQIVEAGNYQIALNQLIAAWNQLKRVLTPITTPIFEFLTQEIKNLTIDIKNMSLEIKFAVAMWNLFLAGFKGAEAVKQAAREAADAYKKLGTGAQQASEQQQQSSQVAQQSLRETANVATAAAAQEAAAEESASAKKRAARQAAAEEARRIAEAQAAEEAARAAATASALAQAYQRAGQAGAAAGLGIAQAMSAATQNTGNYLITLRGVIVLLEGVTEAAARAAQFIGNLPRPTMPFIRPDPVGGSRPSGFAGGGLLAGRGTGTSDSNLAWVSRGEHIMPARAVAQPGVLSFLEALRRSGGNLRGVLDGMGRFARGGLVPRFATGGSVGSMNHVTIQFPGVPPVGGLRASAAVIDQLQKTAALAQVRSGGRKPSRYS